MEKQVKYRFFHKMQRFRFESGKIAKIEQHQRAKIQYKAFTQWEKAILIRRGTAILTYKREKRLEMTVFTAWKGELIRHFTALRKFYTVLHQFERRNKQKAVEKWGKTAYKQCLREKITENIENPRKTRKITAIFLALKYETQINRLLTQIYKRYRTGKQLQKKYFVFQAILSVKNYRLTAENISLDRKIQSENAGKRKIFKKWSHFVQKKGNILTLQSVVFRNCQKRKLCICLAIWE